MIQLAIGAASATGRKARNEDAWVATEPTVAQQTSKGWLLALADGVSQSADGQLAAQSTVRVLAADYYATPETWEPSHALDRILAAHNQWLNAQAQGGEPLATTLTALVLRGQRFTLAHVGDCRAYRLQQGQLECLTDDHVWQHEGYQHVLKRAVGLDQHLVADYRDGDLAAGDVFALLCDGVWETLGEAAIHYFLQEHPEPQAAADALVKAALAAHSQDNVSALVVRIDALPPCRLQDELAASASLSVPKRQKPGQQLAGFTIESVLAESRTTVVYLAHNDQQQRVVIKTLTELAANDDELVERFLAEAWLMKRAASHYLPELVEPAERGWLLYAMRWYPGETLADKLARGERISTVEAVRIGLRLTRALSGLHRQDILHRDIKPDNLHLDLEGRLRLLDLGVAHCPGITPEQASIPGTPSFMAPELFAGSATSRESDLYALGATLYYALTHRYPYGEIEPFQHPHFGDPVPPGRYRPDIPHWLESLLLKAVARDPTQRFETAEEFRIALELGEARPLAMPRKSPLLQRSPAQFWMLVAIGSLALNLLLIFILLASAGTPSPASPAAASHRVSPRS